MTHKRLRSREAAARYLESLAIGTRKLVHFYDSGPYFTENLKRLPDWSFTATDSHGAKLDTRCINFFRLNSKLVEAMWSPGHQGILTGRTNFVVVEQRAFDNDRWRRVNVKVVHHPDEVGKDTAAYDYGAARWRGLGVFGFCDIVRLVPVFPRLRNILVTPHSCVTFKD